VHAIVKAGIPVMGHLGLTPQSIYQFGSYAVRANTTDEAALLMNNSQLLEKAGCFAIVLEKIPHLVASEVTDKLSIPTIGIGAGNKCDGQVLVMHDMLGITKEFSPRFLRRYLNLYEEILDATKKYIADVKSSDFPNEHEQY
jgi:3-methyl-2-oxobutanoate hydroxymethyltransferase